MSREPYKGTIEMCAQRHRLVYATQHDTHPTVMLHRADPLCMPLFSGEDNSGILWRLLEAGHPVLNWAAIEELLNFVPIIDESYQHDLDACNVRMVFHAEELARELNQRMKNRCRQAFVYLVKTYCTMTRPPPPQ
jgi:hypothetical protein